MQALAPGSLLAQIRPANTNDTDAFTAISRTEITRIEVCNSTGSAATYRLFHDDTAAGYGQANAIRYGKSVPSNDADTPVSSFPGSGLSVMKGGKIGVQSGTASALTFSIYGVVAPIAQR